MQYEPQGTSARDAEGHMAVGQLRQEPPTQRDSLHLMRVEMLEECEHFSHLSERLKTVHLVQGVPLLLEG